MIDRAARLCPRVTQLAIAAAGPGCGRGDPIGLPAIGPSRAVAGRWLATGHEGAGVALRPITGRLIAQL